MFTFYIILQAKDQMEAWTKYRGLDIKNTCNMQTFAITM